MTTNSDNIIELKKRPIPDQLRLIADNLAPVLEELGGLSQLLVSRSSYLTVLGAMTSMQMIATELEESN